MLTSLQPSSHVIFLFLVLLGNYDSLPRIFIHTLGVCNCKFILLGYISEAILDFTVCSRGLPKIVFEPTPFGRRQGISVRFWKFEDIYRQKKINIMHRTEKIKHWKNWKGTKGTYNVPLNTKICSQGRIKKLGKRGTLIWCIKSLNVYVKLVKQYW